MRRPPPRRPLSRLGALARPVACLAIALAAAGASRPALAAEPHVTVTVAPGEIRLGERARLTVTIENVQSAPPPALPAIEGMAIRSAGQQMSMSIVNGATSMNVAHNFILEPSRTGEFTVPALRVDAGGRTLLTAPVSLRVLGAGESPSLRAQAPRAGAAPGAQPRDVAALEITLPRRDLFVGEVVPATLRLLIQEGLRVTDASQPVIDAKAFSVNRKVDRQPDQTTTTIDGVRYVVVNFPLAISPVTAGEQTIDARIELRAMLPRSPQRSDGLFGSFFGGLGEPRKLEVIATPATVSVLPLPDAGRPADFTGAIGRFSLAASAEPTKTALGDPITLKVSVAGNGNFDRVVLPAFEAGNDWKAYPENATFAPTDELGLAGKKTFEQAIVPQRATVKGVPARRFSYFDPDSRRYVTLSSQPIALTIAPGLDRPTLAGGRAAAARGGGSGTDAFELAPNEIALGELVPVYRPLATRPWFLAAQTLPMALVAAFAFARRRERRLADADWQRARAARPLIQAQVAAMSRAAAAGDRGAFFAAARRAVQERIAARYDRTAAALTLAEIESHLTGAYDDDSGASGARAARSSTAAPSPGTEPDPLGEIRDLFAQADAASYGGAAADAVDLDAWQRRVTHLLARLESA